MNKKINSWMDAEDFFEAYWKKKGKKAFLFRLVDTKAANQGRKTNKVVIKKNPSDYILTFDSKMSYCEVKYCSDEKYFSFSLLTDGQMAAIRKQEAAGGSYWVYVYSVANSSWYQISCSKILTTIESGKKHLTWSELTKVNLDD